MSVPACSALAPGPGKRRSPLRTPPDAERKSARRTRHHVGFVVLASILVGSMVLGLVATNALLAQSSFRMQDLSQRIDELSGRYLQLTREAAHLSAPGRIAAWARRHGMRLPDDIHILRVPTVDRAAPAGESDMPDLESLAMKAVVEGRP